MSRRDQRRFYAISGCYQDDMRLCAFAVVEFVTHEVTVAAEDVYKDLLNGKYGRWIDYLEQIADEVKHSVLTEWCLDKVAQLELLGGIEWSGDFKSIEKG